MLFVLIVLFLRFRKYAVAMSSFFALCTWSRLVRRLRPRLCLGLLELDAAALPLFHLV